MAGEGLFFTGAVLKNNRNLQQEEIARQQLAMQQEELEMKKQAATDARKKARRDGMKGQVKDFGLDSINSEYLPHLNKEIKAYEDFVADNSESIYEGDQEANRQKRELERGIQTTSKILQSRSSQISTYRKTANAGTVDIFNQDENGNLLHESQDAAFISSLGSGDISELNSQYGIMKGMTKESDWVDPTVALFTAEDSKRKKADLNNDGASWSYIPQQRKDETQKEITTGLTINNGKWDNKDYGKIYKDKRVDIGGELINAQLAFFNESYEGGGNTNPGDHLLEMLDPSSENFNQQVSDDYAKYLGEKISNKGFENLKPIRIQAPGVDFTDEQKEAAENAASLKAYDEKIRTKPAEDGLTSFNGISVRKGADFNPSIVSIKTNIPLTALSEVEGQEIEQAEKWQALMDEGSENIDVDLVGFRVGVDGEHFAVVKYANEVDALVPIQTVAGLIRANSKLKNDTAVNQMLDYSGAVTEQVSPRAPR